MRRAIAALGLAWLCGAAWAAEERIKVRFLVTTPPAAAEPEEIYMSSSLDDWPEGGRKLNRIADRLYEAWFEFPPETGLLYKFLREPKWATVEKDLRNEEIGNRQLRIGGDMAEMVVFHDVSLWADQPDARMHGVKYQRAVPARLDTGAGESTRVGEFRSHPTLFDEKRNIVREALVYLPPGYQEQTTQRYPVLYMLDGQNLFDAETGFGGREWELDETLERLIKGGKLPPVIVVGVYNSKERLNEYAPFRDEKMKAGGGGEEFLGFLVETVKPFIDKTYRTQADAAHTMIGGSSLGGLLALYAAWKMPDTFGGAAVISPSVQWGDGAVKRFIESTPPPRNSRIWMDVGTHEGATSEQRAAYLESARATVEAMKARGLSAARNLHYEEVPGGTHSEPAWAARIDRVLMYLFSDGR